MARPSYIVSAEKLQFYREHGWVVLEDFVSAPEVARIKGILDAMVAGRISTTRRRGDLGGHADRVDPSVENIIQISWPTDLTSELDESEYMRAARDVSEQLYGDAGGTWAMDMNQFLVKMPHTLTDTPWHQDQSYYISLSDPRACNLWLALVDVTADMGCLWFADAPLDAPGPLRPHHAAGRGGGALETDGFSEAAATPVPLRAGSVTVHSHLTPHYARGNSTGDPRLGYVMQTRPSWSVREARLLGFDHGRSAGNTPDEVFSRQQRAEAARAAQWAKGSGGDSASALPPPPSASS